MKSFNSLIVDKKGSKLTIFLLLVLHCCLGTKRPDFDFRVSVIISCVGASSGANHKVVMS